MAVLALSGPVSAGIGGVAGTAVAAESAAADHHCSHAGAPAEAGHADEESPDCCPDGCDACPICTGGVSALHGARVEGPGAVPVDPTRSLGSARGPASVHPGGIDHPPRA